MVNKAIIIGNLGADPEVKTTQSGKQVATFSVATTDKYNGEESTEWHRIVTWGKLADICGQYLHKGSKVYIEGKIQTRKWQDQSGTDRYTTEIVGREMKMLDSKSPIQSNQQSENYTHPDPVVQGMYGNDTGVPF